MMSYKDPVFVTKDDKTYALIDGKVLASANDFAELEEKVSALQQKADRETIAEKVASSTHVETPNGLKGQIVGRSRDLWGEKVTVRFANGRIVQLDVTNGMKFTKEEDPQGNKLAQLEAILEKETKEDIPSLIARRDEVTSAHKLARHLLLQGASHSDQEKLSAISAQAELERIRVSRLIDEIKLADAPDPISHEFDVVEQADLGGHDGGWLDDVVTQMDAETSDLDLEQFMGEGPEAFTAQLDEGMLDDPVGVRDAAVPFVQSKTAFVEQPYRDEYTKLWLSRLEECRRSAVMFNEVAPMPKEASTQDDGIDEGLFL